ncbi:cupin domain-containing protein [Paenibacillus glufosinatiresistens]|uniref:cupin domain-containing protein n=1 Tax=Paenibacillus glufosinatiresistens TaxID=3070657 RepID=UPI00286E243C|nr:cupin domain-containing protein [Paenibacillus sp. YX.27]
MTNPLRPGADAHPEVTRLWFKEDGLLPNNPAFPALLYKSVLKDPDRADTVFAANGWTRNWRDGVFGYPHYHSNAHEVLGVISGTATLQLGGDQGAAVEVAAGDVVVLPAGTAHKRLASSPDFLVAGVYPGGADYNTRRATLAEREEALPEIQRVGLPESDPVYGSKGPLMEAWVRPG